MSSLTRVAALAVLAALTSCGRPPPASGPPAAAPTPPAAQAQPATATTRARPFEGVDPGRCLALAAQASAPDEPACPGFVSAAAHEALATCKEAGGRLTAVPKAQLGALDVNGDGQPELIFALGDNFGCEGAASVFDCGSLGCPYGIYEHRASGWVAIGGVGSDEATGLEALPAAPGMHYASLRGGCFGEANCARITYFEWDGRGYQAAYIDAGGHRVDFQPDLNGLWTLVQDVPVLKSPAADAEVLEHYPVGTEMALIGVARGAPYYYVSPCNACETGFIEQAALRHGS